jgi:prefoldin subunit 5
MALDKHSIELENQIDALREELEQQQNSKDKINELTQTIEQLKSSNFQWELKDQQTNQKFSFHNQQYEKLQENVLSFQQQIQRLEQLLE